MSASETEIMPKNTFAARLVGRALGYALPHRITVLAYHRIVPDSLKPLPQCEVNYSALESVFRSHLNVLASCTNVIPASRLAGWIHGRSTIPPNASIITFDDGYRDNLAHALPILQESKLPAIVYLTTGHVGTQTPLYWDLAAHCFRQAAPGTYCLPKIGERVLQPETLDRVALEWISAIKGNVPDQRNRAALALADVLNVEVDPMVFKGLYLSWDDVRAMHAMGVEFGAHTVTHPILSTLSAMQAQQEIVDSKRKIEEELGKSISSFAYPNGLPNDYAEIHADMVQKAGFKMAVTLSPRPTSQRAVRDNPYRISRIYVGLKDTPMRFVLKLCGVAHRHR